MLPRLLFIMALPLTVAACTTASLEELGDPVRGFAPVRSRTAAVTGKETVWVQSSAESRALAERVRGLIQKKAISADLAVQVALLNNKGLQASYADIGLSAADVWQESLLINPTLSVGMIGVDPVRTLEGAVASNILAVMTRKRRVATADARFRQAQLRAAEQTLKLAADTRRAWITAVAARERVGYLNQAQGAADAASALAQKLGETGAFTKTGQAREHVFFAELAGQTAGARLEERVAREELTRRMGLWGYDLGYKLPGTLPPLPKGATAKRAIEAEALQGRVDLAIARLDLEALALSYGLTQSTRYLSDLELVTGVEVERETDEEGKTETTISPTLEVGFTIPVFDSGKARLRKAELSYMRAANLLAERAVNIRSEARGAYDAYRSNYDIARHYRNNVLPLRKKIEDESVLTYNGMITNTFELLADTRAKISSILLSLDAKRAFWLADVDLGTAIHGGGAGAAAETPEVAAEAGGDE